MGRRAACGGWCIARLWRHACRFKRAPRKASPAFPSTLLPLTSAGRAHLALSADWPLHAHPALVLNASPHPLCLQIGYFKRILRETETEGVKLISAPSPTEVVEAAAKQVS